VPYIAFAGFEVIDLFGVNVKAQDSVSDLKISACQGQAHIAQTYDADDGCKVFEFLD
jgi:hypothetical protein